MRQILLCVLVVLTSMLVGACNSTENTTSNNPPVAQTSPIKATTHKDGIRRITVAELRTLVDRGEAFIVDVRNEPAYKQGHIKGAKLIPTNEVLKRTDEFPRDKTIVTYCS